MIDFLMNHVLQVNDIKKTDDLKTIIESITYGDTVLFVDGYREAILMDTKGFKTRSIAEPDSEKVIQGPKEGFTEGILVNLSMIRRRVRTNLLKMKYYTIGAQTQTKVCVCYIEGIAKQEIIDELVSRIEKIDIDGIIDSNYVKELITDSGISPFTTVGVTERPDVVVGKLLEGRIALVVDGTPVVLTAPYLFVENFQNSEDYYIHFYYASFSRLLRILGFALTILVPAIYIAIVGYHLEILPSPLLRNFTLEQQGVPLSASIEVFVLLITFDLLRETGVRMPSSVGQALSIVGALVIGQAAVSARLVASPTIIVVALTGITNLLVPKLNASVIVLRYSILLLASLLGFVGITIGIAVFLMNIISLKSFGVNYFMNDEKLTPQRIKDIMLRAPWWKMKTRPKQLTNNIVRMKDSKED